MTPANLLAHRIAQLRRMHGLTQAQLANRSGIQRPIISRIERGIHEPTFTTLIRLASALGCELYEILCVLDLHSVPRRKVA